MLSEAKRAEALKILSETYPDAKPALHFQNPYQLLVAVILSAQCTDVKVNAVTPALFAAYPDAHALAAADPLEVEGYIRTCGLYHNKAKNLVATGRALVECYGGEVPADHEKLTQLPGVGRKTANLILSDIFGHPAIVADTHCMRIAGKLGLTDSGKDPYKVEMDLKKIVEPTEQASLCHRFVHFGRDICTARSPKCELCALSDICREYANNLKKAEKAKKAK